MLVPEDHDQRTPPSSRPSSSSTPPPLSSTDPSTSSRCGAFSTRSSNRRTNIQSAAAPIGRLTKKIHRHET